MSKRSIIAGLISLLALSGVVGANLAAAAGDPTKGQAAVEETTAQGPDTDSVRFEHVDPNEGPDAQETERADTEAGSAEEATGSEADTDSHGDTGANTQHECPPDCDAAAGEVG